MRRETVAPRVHPSTFDRPMTTPLLTLALLLVQGSRPATPAPDAPAPTEPVFSGPQKGEKTPPFRVIDVKGTRDLREFDPTAEAASGAALYFFFPSPNRILARAIHEMDAMASDAKASGLRSYFVGLFPDRLEGEQRLRDVWTSLRPKTPASLSVDGLEGPGAWGLNKKCLVTVVLAKDGKVAFNRAVLSPGERDFDEIRAALSELVGRAVTSRPAEGAGMSGMSGRDAGGREPAGRDAPARGPASRPRPRGN